MQNIKLKLSISFAVLSVIFSMSVPNALAEEVIVTGNGSDSVSQADVSTNTQTTVQQSNTAVVTNNVIVNTNTGNNEANNNTGGDTAIATGDTHVSTVVDNVLNTSVVDQSCGCVPMNSSSTTISGNNASSSNSINQASNNQIAVSVLNAAQIINNTVVSANTGNNTARNNSGGNVTISSGNIYTENVILNRLINLSKITLAQNTTTNSVQKIAGNGAFSLNNINAVSNTDLLVTVSNTSDILNDIKSFLNTGGNSADSNSGDVSIVTGDALAVTIISNSTNASIIDVSCGCQKETPPNTPPTAVVPPAVTTTSSSGRPSQIVQGATATLNETAGSILPSTGGSWMFFALIGNILMFLLGAYLRLRSGRSPALALAI